MNYIEKVKIIGFWGDKTVEMPFNKDVNFLIGINGSGKTTVINLIAAALSADFPTLDRLPFSSMIIQLKEVHGKKKASIEVNKKRQERSPYPAIIFKIKSSATSKPIIYELDRLEEARVYRSMPPEYFYERKIRVDDSIRKTRHDIIEQLQNLVNVSWLSIHRTTGPFRAREEKSIESTIDQKLDDLSNEFVKYFSLLDKQATLETDKFQQTIFLSLLSDETEQKIFSTMKQLNPDKEKLSLIEIYRLFKLDERIYLKRVEKHFDSYSDATRKVEKEETIELKDLSIILTTRRIHLVIQEWNNLTEKQKEIYNPKTIFLKMINSLMKRKELQINEKNELGIKTQSGKTFPLKYLSSGEKQLLIILGEAMLQQSTPWIYIADEPELSLHVTWQESLVRNLRDINPNAQIIFATHSPDIVSTFGNNVFNMEKVIS